MKHMLNRNYWERGDLVNQPAYCKYVDGVKTKEAVIGEIINVDESGLSTGIGDTMYTVRLDLTGHPEGVDYNNEREDIKTVLVSQGVMDDLNG